MQEQNKIKSTNAFKSLKKNLYSMKSFKGLLILGLLVGVIVSIISVRIPHKLSEFTDVISSSLKVDFSKLENIAVETDKNLKASNPKDIIYENEKIGVDDQVKFLNVLGKIKKLNINISNINEITTEKQDSILEVYKEFPKSITNIIEPKIDFSAIKTISIIIILLQVSSLLLSSVQVLSMAEAINNYAKNLRNKVSEKINKLPLNYFDTKQLGDILSIMTNDIDTLVQSLNDSLSPLVTAFTMFLGSLIMMFITSWILALVSIFSAILGVFASGFILSKSQMYFKQRQIELAYLNGHVEEMISGINVVKIYNAKEESFKKFNKLNKKLYKANLKSKFLSGLFYPVMFFISNFGYLAVAVVGSILITKGMISFGVIVAFLIYIRMFTNSFTTFSQAMSSIQSSSAASERVFEFLSESELSDETKKEIYLDPNKVKGDIEFKNIIFKYPSNEEPTIKGFSCKALAGQKIAIVGKTGAGKSTIVNLLMKFYEISDGDILIDGHSIHDIKRENIHELFTMILQDTWLFKGTVKENIVYNMENISDEELHTLCKFIGLEHFILSLPNGYNNIIKDIDYVSAGQRQLLTIARGMLKNAPLLILDEATSNVDTHTEELIQKAMDKLMVGKTSFIIAHRLSTIINADLILVMDEGNIVEQGTHTELMAKNGYYADLYNSQFSLE